MSTQPQGQEGWRADDSTFGARLALVRQRMGWGNVKEAALACGLAVESWRNWERDGRQPRDYVDVCRAISTRTGLRCLGIPDTLHSLRHLCLTEACRVGGLRVAQEIAGHASSSTTAPYTKVARTDLREVMREVARRLAS